jgi:hypothetical protein
MNLSLVFIQQISAMEMILVHIQLDDNLKVYRRRVAKESDKINRERTNHFRISDTSSGL